MLIKVLSIFLMFLSPFANAENDICSTDRQNDLREMELIALDQVKNWLFLLENKYGVDIKSLKQPQTKESRKQRLDQIEIATKVVLCTQDKLKKGLTYVCSKKLHNAAAWTLPIVSNRVFLDEKSFWNSSFAFKISVIIHEATHKCGTNDAKYFQGAERPHNVGIAGWSTIADTYSYWSYKYFCIPDIDCR